MILADLRVENVGDLLMVAISIVLRQQYPARHSKPTYLGIVTPAFSQAWIKAEPAKRMSITISPPTQQVPYLLLTLFSHLDFESVLPQIEDA